MDVDKLSVTLWRTNLFAYIADPLLVVAMLVTPEVTPAEKPVSRDDIISIIRDETLDLRKEVADNKNRIENVERRINSNYVKMVNLCTKFITPKCDWLRSIRKLLVDAGILKEEETEAHVLGIDQLSSRPRNNIYVIKVSDTLKRKLVNPTADVRKKFEDLSIKTGKGKSEAIRCYAKLTKEEEATRSKTRYYVDQLIRYNQATNKTDSLVKVPSGGRLDRIIVEPKIRAEGFKREYLTYEQVAEKVGSTVELIDRSFEDHTKRREVNGRKRANHSNDGNDIKRVR